MATSTVDGLVSGLSTSSIIAQLIASDSTQQNQLKTNVSTVNQKVGAYTSVNSKLLAVQQAAVKLGQLQGVTTKSDASYQWSATKAAATGDAVTVAATSTAASGQLTLKVDSLAAGRSVMSEAVVGDDAGAAQALGFPMDVYNRNGDLLGVVKPSAGTLADVSAAIKQAGFKGITATAVRVGDNQYRLQITSTTTGEAAGDFRMVPQIKNGDGTYTSAGKDGDVATGYTDMVKAADAKLFIVPAGGDSAAAFDITSSSNTFADIMPGVTITAAKTGTSTINVASDPTQVSDAVAALITATNAALDEIGNQSKAGVAGPGGTVTGGGVLRGDSTLRGLRTQLLSAVTSALGDGKTSAASYGIQSTRDGKLSFDKDVFTKAYAADPTKVQQMLAPTSLKDPAVKTEGIVERLGRVADGAVNSTTGSLTTVLKGQQSLIKDLNSRISDWDDRLAQRKARYESYYSRLEVSLGSLQTKSTWLAGQLSGLR
ncbi:flagellar filament capping protein FliD [Kineococcus rubinsiae]|uniref:flagellar filament capping protein FliD n=1 Tax=Kineococcus rubinsiae TaxID=2609562 RepID=UPI001431DAF6|nr:flagellar filament capping protein FliD [Kineococcus rubinsiae]NIZ93483.1 flagellar filament capping protein FliD [Kineococcus rubinsiae]